jgi:hypothetical protein
MVTISVAKPFSVDGSDWQAKLSLRDRAREEILKRCGEPDLAHETSS